MAQVNVS